MTPLADDEIDRFLAASALWRREGDALVATLVFPDFKAALSFMVAIGLEAEGAGHHPGIHNTYNKVTLRLTTHDAGNRVTARDTGLARTIEAVAARFTAAPSR